MKLLILFMTIGLNFPASCYSQSIVNSATNSISMIRKVDTTILCKMLFLDTLIKFSSHQIFRSYISGGSHALGFYDQFLLNLDTFGNFYTSIYTFSKDSLGFELSKTCGKYGFVRKSLVLASTTSYGGYHIEILKKRRNKYFVIKELIFENDQELIYQFLRNTANFKMKTIERIKFSLGTKSNRFKYLFYESI